MEDLTIDELALELSDLEVALVLCLVAREHCLVETTKDSIHDVAKELALICSNTLGFSYAILDCSAATSCEDFTKEILVSDARRNTLGQSSRPPLTTEHSSNFSTRSIQESKDRAKSPLIPGYSLDQRNVVNVVIAKHFNHVSEDVQVQALELMRSKRLITQTAILNAPEDSFLFIPVAIRTSEQLRPRFNRHLNDHFFVSHFHDDHDGYIHLEEGNDYLSDGQMSVSSVVRKSDIRVQKKYPRINQELLENFRRASDRVTVGADVTRYIQDLVVFLRLSRAVAGGVSAKANSQLTRFSKLLAPLHGIDYLTPSIVALATKKVFRHRIVVAHPEDDRSLQYGSDFKAVSQVLAQVSPESILENVIAEVEAPL